MNVVTFRFAAALNDFLDRQQRQQPVCVPWLGSASVKDMIEAVGVPHPEVGLIMVRDTAVGLGYGVQAGDTIDLYPFDDVPSQLNVAPLYPRPQPHFVLDVHLGRLAGYLRLLGFDTLYRNDYDDPELAHIAASERRILLTRDLGLLKRSEVIYGAYVRSTDPPVQAHEIVRRFRLRDALHPFARCSRCNGLLAPVAKALVADRLLPETRAAHDTFYQCQSCQHVYWRGSHWGRIQQFVDGILNSEQ